jgi:hypothetical protein
MSSAMIHTMFGGAAKQTGEGEKEKGEAHK